eukprot:gene13191-9037_t
MVVDVPVFVVRIFPCAGLQVVRGVFNVGYLRHVAMIFLASVSFVVVPHFYGFRALCICIWLVGARYFGFLIPEGWCEFEILSSGLIAGLWAVNVMVTGDPWKAMQCRNGYELHLTVTDCFIWMVEIVLDWFVRMDPFIEDGFVCIGIALWVCWMSWVSVHTYANSDGMVVKIACIFYNALILVVLRLWVDGSTAFSVIFDGLFNTLFRMLIVHVTAENAGVTWGFICGRRYEAMCLDLQYAVGAGGLRLLTECVGCRVVCLGMLKSDIYQSIPGFSLGFTCVVDVFPCGWLPVSKFLCEVLFAMPDGRRFVLWLFLMSMDLKLLGLWEYEPFIAAALVGFARECCLLCSCGYAEWVVWCFNALQNWLQVCDFMEVWCLLCLWVFGFIVGVTLSFEDIIVLHVVLVFISYYNRLDFRDLRFRCGQFFVGGKYCIMINFMELCSILLVYVLRVLWAGGAVSYVVSIVTDYMLCRGDVVCLMCTTLYCLFKRRPSDGLLGCYTLLYKEAFGLLAFNCKYVLQLIEADILLIDFVCFDMLWFDSQFALPERCLNLLVVFRDDDADDLVVLHYGMYFMLVISYWGCLCYLGLARACVDVFWVVAFFCSNDLCSFLTTLLGFHSDWLLLLLLNIVDTPFLLGWHSPLFAIPAFKLEWSADVSVFGLEVDAFLLI